MVRLGYYIYDGEDVDVAHRGQVFTADECGAYCDKALPFEGVFRDDEGGCFDCGYYFVGLEVIS